MIVQNKDDRGITWETTQISNGILLAFERDRQGQPWVHINGTPQFRIRDRVLLLTDNGVLLEEHTARMHYGPERFTLTKDFTFKADILNQEEPVVRGGYQFDEVAIYKGKTLAEDYFEDMVRVSNKIVLIDLTPAGWTVMSNSPIKGACPTNLQIDDLMKYNFWALKERVRPDDYTGNHVTMNLIDDDDFKKLWYDNIADDPEVIIDAIRANILKSTKKSYDQLLFKENMLGAYKYCDTSFEATASFSP